MSDAPANEHLKQAILALPTDQLYDILLFTAGALANDRPDQVMQKPGVLLVFAQPDPEAF